MKGHEGKEASLPSSLPPSPLSLSLPPLSLCGLG